MHIKHNMFFLSFYFLKEGKMTHSGSAEFSTLFYGFPYLISWLLTMKILEILSELKYQNNINPCCLLWRSSCTHHMTCNPRIHLFCIFLPKLVFTANIYYIVNTYQTCRMVDPELMIHLLQVVVEELILPLAYLWLELQIFLFWFIG